MERPLSACLHGVRGCCLGRRHGIAAPLLQLPPARAMSTPPPLPAPPYPGEQELSGYFLPDDKFQAACTALADPACTTTALRLYHNEPHHTAMVLGGLSAGNASLEELDVFELDPAAAAPLAAYLAAAPRLASLVLHHVHGEAAARDLAPGLAASRTLSHLHFTLLDAHSVGHVAQALSQWQGPARLAHLRLERCTLQREQAAALAAALGRQAAALCRLELAACVLGEGAAAAMLGAPGFAELRLEHLDLSRCAVGAAGEGEPQAVVPCVVLAASDMPLAAHTMQQQRPKRPLLLILNLLSAAACWRLCGALPGWCRRARARPPAGKQSLGQPAHAAVGGVLHRG